MEMKIKEYMHTAANRETASRKCNNSGFSLSELMATVALIGILGAMVVSLIPAIIGVMGKVSTKARAEMLMNNTVTVLRNHMRYSSEVNEVSANKYRFKAEDNWIYEVSVDPDNNGWIIMAPYVKNGDTITQLEIDSNSLVQDWHLLTNKAANENLNPTFESITYADGLFTITGLKVIDAEGNVKSQYHGADGNPKALIIRTNLAS